MPDSEHDSLLSEFQRQTEQALRDIQQAIAAADAEIAVDPLPPLVYLDLISEPPSAAAAMQKEETPQEEDWHQWLQSKRPLTRSIQALDRDTAGGGESSGSRPRPQLPLPTETLADTGPPIKDISWSRGTEDEWHTVDYQQSRRYHSIKADIVDAADKKAVHVAGASGTIDRLGTIDQTLSFHSELPEFPCDFDQSYEQPVGVQSHSPAVEAHKSPSPDPLHRSILLDEVDNSILSAVVHQEQHKPIVGVPEDQEGKTMVRALEQLRDRVHGLETEKEQALRRVRELEDRLMMGGSITGAAVNSERTARTILGEYTARNSNRTSNTRDMGVDTSSLVSNVHPGNLSAPTPSGHHSQVSESALERLKLENQVVTLKSKIAVLERRMEYSQFVISNLEQERDEAWAQLKQMKRELPSPSLPQPRLNNRPPEDIHSEQQSNQPFSQSILKEKELLLDLQKENISTANQPQMTLDAKNQFSPEKHADFSDDRFKQRIKQQLREKLLLQKNRERMRTEKEDISAYQWTESDYLFRSKPHSATESLMEKLQLSKSPDFQPIHVPEKLNTATGSMRRSYSAKQFSQSPPKSQRSDAMRRSKSFANHHQESRLDQTIGYKKDLPFIPAGSGSSYSLTANIQKVWAALKVHDARNCTICAHHDQPNGSRLHHHASENTLKVNNDEVSLLQQSLEREYAILSEKYERTLGRFREIPAYWGSSSNAEAVEREQLRQILYDIMERLDYLGEQIVHVRRVKSAHAGEQAGFKSRALSRGRSDSRHSAHRKTHDINRVIPKELAHGKKAEMFVSDEFVDYLDHGSPSRISRSRSIESLRASPSKSSASLAALKDAQKLQNDLARQRAFEHSSVLGSGLFA